MGMFDESMERNLRIIAEAIAGSGIVVNAEFTINDRVGINGSSNTQIDPAIAGNQIYASSVSSQSGVTISTSAVLIAGANPLRKSIIINNIGLSGNLYIGPTNAVSSGLAAAGTKIGTNGSFSEAPPGNWMGAIWGIMDNVQTTQTISVWDRT